MSKPIDYDLKAKKIEKETASMRENFLKHNFFWVTNFFSRLLVVAVEKTSAKAINEVESFGNS